MPVRLSVTEVHWLIIANLGFKFRSHFTAHCGRRAVGGRRAAHRAACGRIISRHASHCSARLSCCFCYVTMQIIFGFSVNQFQTNKYFLQLLWVFESFTPQFAALCHWLAPSQSWPPHCTQIKSSPISRQSAWQAIGVYWRWGQKVKDQGQLSSVLRAWVCRSIWLLRFLVYNGCAQHTASR